MSLEIVSSTARTRGWSLTATAFERLLDALGNDRERAALEYERLHARVAGLLRWWGSSRAEDLADETLDRVARKLEEGAEIRRGSLGAYVRGVARMVFYEATRRAEHDPLPEEVDIAAPQTDAEQERSLRCLDRCLERLSAADRDCVLRYYGEGDQKKIEARRSLAAGLGISPTALRLRTFRLRDRLEGCVRGCVEAS
jgi:DNA-directed RNA polymerase specialized sigma24 family protein